GPPLLFSSLLFSSLLFSSLRSLCSLSLFLSIGGQRSVNLDVKSLIIVSLSLLRASLRQAYHQHTPSQLLSAEGSSSWSIEDEERHSRGITEQSRKKTGI